MKLFGLTITNGEYSDIIKLIENKISSNEKISVHNVNAYILLEASKNELLKKSLAEYSFLFLDGIAIYYALKLMGYKNIFRITGTDLYWHILEYAQNQNKKVYFYGGSYEAKTKIESSINNKFPSLCVSGYESGDITKSKIVIEKINKLSPDILFVGLGTPNQEYWIMDNKGKIDVPLIISVGSGIEFISGTEKRAPKLLRKYGFEWLYRLICDPRRLWKRYILGVPHFIYLVLKDHIKSSKNDRK